MKIDNRLFSFAGTSSDSDGVYKARFANDLTARPKVLAKEGHSNFVLVALPKPMTKLDAIAYLQENKPEGVNQEALVAKAAYIRAQEQKLTDIANGTVRRRGRPASVKTSDAKEGHTKTATKTVKTPAENSVVTTIVNAARRGNSIRAKAMNHSSKISARQASTN